MMSYTDDKEPYDCSILLEDCSLLDNSHSSSSPEPPSSSTGRDWASFLRRAKDEDIKNIVIADNIHGLIEVPQVCQAVIDTPQFDRLRGVRQLGCAHFVYPAAKHSRWEHSLGVMHLAGQFVDHIIKKKPGSADQIDRICVMLAGLCHDLGHGPFSHLWESFVSEASEEGSHWRHEKTSLDMLDVIIKDNDLAAVFTQNGLTDNDMTFVKEMIFGPLHMGEDHDGGWPYLGRGPDKFFLYEIVANKISSIDVDKWDYMLRDNAALKIGITFDYKRFIMHSDILEVGGRTRLCIRKKEAENVQDMFLDRARLHRKGYQHRTIKIIDRMLVDALLAADPHLRLLKDQSSAVVPLSQACFNVRLFAKLSDDFLTRTIQFSEEDELEEARQILAKIARRQLYKLVGSVEYCGETGVKAAGAEVDLNNLIRNMQGTVLRVNDLAVIKKKVNLGMGKINPIEKVLFVDKFGRVFGFNSDQMRQVLPQEIISEVVLVVCRRDEVAVLDEARVLFKQWAKSTFRGRSGISVRLVE